MTLSDAITRSDPAIEAVIQARSRAIAAKDADAVGECQTEDFVCYSLAPPLVTTDGPQGLEAWFATWDGQIGYDLRDLGVTAGDDVAFAHGLVRLTGRKLGGEAADVWFRQTLGLRKTGRGWRISHEHDSVPFYMDGSFRAAVDLKP